MLQESRPNLLPLGISLQDLLHLPILQNSKVLAGSQGLSNLVTGATLAGAPDIVAPAHPGELFLVDWTYSQFSPNQGEGITDDDQLAPSSSIQVWEGADGEDGPAPLL